MMNFGDNMWQWFMGFHGIWTVVFLAIVLIVGIAIVRDWSRNRKFKFTLNELAERYAAGDIDREEYLDQRKKFT